MNEPKLPSSKYLFRPLKSKSILYLGICLLLSTGIPFLLFGPVTADNFSARLQVEKREIQILDHTRQLATTELEMSQADIDKQADLENYIHYLEARITSLCARIFSIGGSHALSGLPCPPPGRFVPGREVPSAISSGEKIQEMDQMLQEELGKFDDMLAEEQERIACSRRPQTGNNGGPAGMSQEGGPLGAGGHGQSTESERSDGQYEDEGSGEWQETRANQEGNNTLQKNSGNKEKEDVAKGGIKGNRPGIQTPGAPPISKDDDIVARQLREAAERETDPRLRKRLWEEYRRYKEGLP